MEKKPLIPIDEGPLDVWYESPSVMIVKKPRGIKVHPSGESENGTLLNRLFQHNRWLAEMETSTSAGVLHIFERDDLGLMVFNKNDDYTETLKGALADQAIEFSYLVTVKGNPQINDTSDFSVTIHSQKQSAGYMIIDLTAANGNTQALRDGLFSDTQVSDITFYCYQISLTLPHNGEHHTVTLRDASKAIPHIAVYHAPP